MTDQDDKHNEESWRALTGAAGEPSRASTMYRMRLNGQTPDLLLSSPRVGRPVDPRRGTHILQGRWKFGVSRLETPPDRAPWGPPFPSLHFSDRIHRFHWLRDLISLGEEGEARARSLVVSWADHFGRWHEFAWRMDVTADRVINWLAASPSVVAPLDQPARSDVLECLARQARHLVLGDDEPVTLQGALRRQVAMVLAGACIPDMDSCLEKGLEGLETEVRRQLLVDGGHVTRSPQALAEMLIDLQITEDLLLRMGRAAPEFLTRAQSRMQIMLKFLTAPDGGLVVSNGGSVGAHGLSRTALAPFGEGGGRFSFAQLTGFHRIEAGSLTVMVDTGDTPPPEFSHHAGAGCLAVTVLDGADRLITQMGAHEDLEPEWRMAARRTAAHSTLSIQENDSATFSIDRESGLTHLGKVTGVVARRLEKGDRFEIESQHDGWRERYGLIHRRCLQVRKDGGGMEGVDALLRPLSETRSAPSQALPFAVRFQLHPDVEAVIGEDRKSVQLSVVGSGRVWRFECNAEVLIEASVHAASPPRRAAAQLVIKAEADPLGDGASGPNQVCWSLTLTEDKAL